MKIEIYKKDFKKDVEGFGAPNGIEVPAMPCLVTVDISGKIDDKDFNILRDRLMGVMTKDPIADKLCVQLYKITKSTDELVAALTISEPKSIPAVLKDCQKQLQHEVSKFEADVSKAFLAIWKKFLEDKDKYKTYKFKAGIDMTVNIVSLLGSIASLAASATPAAPVTAVMGTYGILKNFTKICVQCRNLYIEAETVAKDVESDCKKLKAKFDKLQEQLEKDLDKEAKKTKLQVKGTDLGIAFGNKLFGDVVGVFATGVQSATKKNSLYGNKIRGVQEKTREFAKDYLQMIDHMQSLYEYVRKLDDEYKVFVSKAGYSKMAQPLLAKRQKKIKVAFDAWNGATKAMKTLNDQVAASEKRYEDNLVKQKEFQKAIDQAEGAFKTKKWAEAGRWLGVLADVGLAVGPNGAAAWEGANKIVETTMKLVVIAEKEVITELKERL